LTKLWATLCSNFKNLTNVNNRPLGDNSPNLVTLFTMRQQTRGHGCQMVYFQTKNPNLGQFRGALDWKMYKYFMAISNNLQTFGIFYDHLVHFVFIWYFGIMYQVKSGNPALGPSRMWKK
jgi:hypothetical protein